MKQITPEKYIEGVNSIYEEQPEYQTGGDGSNGKCDCIGMCRGGLEREGVKDIQNMRGTNQAARKTIENLHQIKSASELQLGDVVLKTRDKDDKTMPLPDRYRKGGADYDPKWGETNFTHIGTVTKVNPLEITHMTSPTAKKDKSLGKWKYGGQLPWVKRGAEPGPDPDPEPAPEPEPEPETDWAVVVAENGDTVKIRAKPTQDCKLYWDVPVGSEVMVLDWNAATDKKHQTWSRIQWAGQAGYMLRKFLRDEDDEEPAPNGFTVIIPGLTEEQADAIVREYPGAMKTAG